MTEQKLKAGVVGLGILGRQYLDFFAKRPDVTTVAVCDVRAEAAEEQAVQHKATAYTNYRRMLAEQRPDLLVVATPDHLHREPTLAAIEAGTPYLIQEKPLATELREAEEIYAAVERSGTRLFLNYANRAMPYDVATYHVLQQGLIGVPVYAESRLDDNISVPNALWGERSRDFAGGSSPAHFLLSHVVDLLHWWFAPQRVTEVYAITQRKILGFTPDLYDAFLTFDGGLKVRIKAEWIKHMDQIVEFYTSITGATGTVIYNKRPGFGVEESWRANFSQPQDVEDLAHHQHTLGERGVHTRLGRHYRLTGEEYDLSTVRLSLEHIGPDGAHGLMLVGPMLDALAQNTLTPSSWQGLGPLPTHVDGLRQVQVVQAILDSAQSGRAVSP
jgi:predicted dehydrogenase